MAKTNGNGDLKNKLAKKANESNGLVKKSQTIIDYLSSDVMKKQFEMALPKHFETERFVRIAITEMRRTPELQECTLQSVLGAFMQAAQLGLEPGLLGQCYLIPFRNRKTGQKECQFVIGYKGMIDLARRSGNIESIYAQVVKENDEFEYQYGLDPDLKHKPAMKDRGKTIGAYAVAKFKDGGYQFEFMSVDEIEKRRERSAAKNSGPWVTDYDEMCMKTVIRHMFKYLPISIEIMRQVVSADESIKTEVKPDMTEVPNIFETEYEVIQEEQEGHQEENVSADKQEG